MTKKIALIISTILSIMSVVFFYSNELNLSSPQERGTYFGLSALLFPAIPFFIFSLITYKMNDKIFQSWWKFARVWTPLSFLVIGLVLFEIFDMSFLWGDYTGIFFSLIFSIILFAVSATLVGYEREGLIKNSKKS